MAETKTFYVMVMTRCVIDGELSDSFDLSTRMILAASEAEVRSRVEAESPHSYQNPAGETVEWPLSRIMSIDECGALESGDEVTGFIFHRTEFDELT